MSLSNDVIEKISIEVIRVLRSRFSTFPEGIDSNRNAPFHEAFLKAFSDKLSAHVTDSSILISLSSWLHGLNTTLGQSFFENVAHILSCGEKKTFDNKIIAVSQKSRINEIITKLKNADYAPNKAKEEELIFTDISEERTNALNFTADVFVNDSASVTAIEIKSVKPNAGEMRGEKQKMLEGKAVLKALYPKLTVEYYIGFPFDPTVDTIESNKCSFDKSRFLDNIVDGHKYFDKTEVLLASELWDFLSGVPNTMEQILDIINKISTPRFMELFEQIRNPNDYSVDEYCVILEGWNLYSEIELVRSVGSNRDVLEESIKLHRIYNTSCFKDAGDYNLVRYNSIMAKINKKTMP